MADNLYKNGFPWHRDFYTNCLEEQIKERIEINMPSVILIDGGQGQGKTTLAVHTADYFNKKTGLPPLDLKINSHNQIGMGGVDFVSKFNRAHRSNVPVLIYDEAGDYSRGSTLTWFNLQMSKLFQKIRSANMHIILCLPNFNILDNRLFDDECIRGAIHCHSRQITKTCGNFDVYDMEQISWIRHWYDRLPRARRHSCYSMVSPLFQSHFKNLPKIRAKQLAILSNYGKDKERQSAEINMKGLISNKDIMRYFQRSYIWVQTMLHKYKLEPETKLGKVNYYSKSILDVLEKYIQTKRK